MNVSGEEPDSRREERRARVLNLRHSRTGYQDTGGTWYGLDNAATIMPPLTDSVTTSLFRMEAALDHQVDTVILGQALGTICKRYPYFVVEIGRGLFWYYLEPHKKPMEVVPDSRSPCQDYMVRHRGTPLFRVRAGGRTVAVEFSHILTDGTGGIRFLRSLLVQYFKLLGVEPGAPLGTGEFEDIPDPDSLPSQEEYEDAYHRHFTGELPPPGPGTPAFHISSPKLPRHDYRVIEGTMSLASVREKARASGVTVTELLCAVYLDALQSIWLETPRFLRRRPHLMLEVPVNMRRFYPTRSNRNFSLFVIVGQDMRLGRRDFDEILSRTHHQMRMENDVRNIARQITRNVGGSRKIAVRLVPLVVKDFFSRILFSSLGENLVSSFLSNLGPVTMPPGPAARIERFGFVPATSPITLVNSSVLSWKDSLVVTFGSLARSRRLEMHFFRRLRQLGVHVTVRCNLPGGE